MQLFCLLKTLLGLAEIFLNTIVYSMSLEQFILRTLNGTQGTGVARLITK